MKEDILRYVAPILAFFTEREQHLSLFRENIVFGLDPVVLPDISHYRTPLTEHN